MVYQGAVAPAQITERLNNVHFDVKSALKTNQHDISVLLDQMASPDQKIIIDGREFDKNSTAAAIAINNKMSNLSNQTTTILSVFQQMFALEKSVGGASGG